MRTTIVSILILIVLGSIHNGTAADFNNRLYAKVLQRFVRNDRVDYAALKNDSADFDAYLVTLTESSKNQLEQMNDKEKIAFYLNAYNAYTIKTILDHYPVKSIKDIKGVWDKLNFSVAGENLTLNDIEHEILRKKFTEPRIHFALNCASISCPSLRGEPYEGRRLDKQLDEQTKRFLNNPERNYLDKKQNRLYLSKIFKWFKEDFGNVRIFVSKYLPKDTARQILSKEPKLKYLKYDWKLNEGR